MKQINNILVLGLVAVLLAACTERDDMPSPDSDEVVSFSANVLSSSQTRAYTGTIDNLDALKAVGDGFGVFGYLTEANDWTTAKGAYAVNAAEYPTPDFMYNQSVYWGVQYLDGSTPEYGWVYYPPKYWPNSTENATARRISFFAYAPYTAEGQTVGVTGFPSSSDKSPHITYKVGTIDQQSDLLYASCMDATRNGNGLITAGSPLNTYQKVPLTFHHALSRIDVFIQRIYDEETFTGKVPAGSDYTRLFVSKLEMTATSGTFYQEGKLNLENGTWTGTTAYTGNKLTFTEGEFTELIRGTATSTAAVIQDYELDKWKRNPGGVFGVDDTERPLFANGRSLMILPDGSLTITPTITYSLVTKDNTLELGYLTDSDGNRFKRITNTVTGDPIHITLEKGKRYTLLVHVGVESVQFEVVSVEDWDFPMRFNPDVEPYKDETNEKVVNES